MLATPAEVCVYSGRQHDADIQTTHCLPMYCLERSALYTATNNLTFDAKMGSISWFTHLQVIMPKPLQLQALFVCRYVPDSATLLS